jgi:hypothetical protein
MSRRHHVVLAAATAAAAAIAASCGGSSSSSDSGGSTESTTTAPAATGGTANAHARLTQDQWSSAQASRTAFRKALANAQATTTKCLHGAKSPEDFQNIPKTQACVGDVYTELQKAAGDSKDVLEGFTGTVSGACAQALNDLIGAVGLYQASAAEMQRTIDSPTLAGYPAASQDLQSAFASGQAKVAAFETDCAPA